MVQELLQSLEYHPQQLKVNWAGPAKTFSHTPLSDLKRIELRSMYAHKRHVVRDAVPLRIPDASTLTRQLARLVNRVDTCS